MDELGTHGEACLEGVEGEVWSDYEGRCAFQAQSLIISGLEKSCLEARATQARTSMGGT